MTTIDSRSPFLFHISHPVSKVAYGYCCCSLEFLIRTDSMINTSPECVSVLISNRLLFRFVSIFGSHTQTHTKAASSKLMAFSNKEQQQCSFRFRDFIIILNFMSHLSELTLGLYTLHEFPTVKPSVNQIKSFA